MLFNFIRGAAIRGQHWLRRGDRRNGVVIQDSVLISESQPWWRIVLGLVAPDHIDPGGIIGQCRAWLGVGRLLRSILLYLGELQLTGQGVLIVHP